MTPALPSRTRSVRARKRGVDEFAYPRGCSRMTSSSGSRPCERPCVRRLFSVSTAWPESSSFCISSNRRAGGTFWMSQRRNLREWAQRSSASIATPTLVGDSHCAQHPHRILTEAGDGRSDQLQAARAHIGDTAHVVPYGVLGGRIEVQRVDGEVAARGVLAPASRRRCRKAGDRARRWRPRRSVPRETSTLRALRAPTWTWTRRKRRPMMKERAETEA